MYTLRNYQQDAVNAIYNHLRTKDNNPCAVLPTGCHAKGHPILMFDGSIKPVEDVSVGDVLMGADSIPRHVLALCRGREMMYRITPKRGEAFTVNGNHVLSLVQTNTSNTKHHPSSLRGGEITNVSVAEWAAKSKTWKHIHKLYRTKVEFPQNGEALPMPPYILGLLLGDGSIIHGVQLTTADDEIADVFKDYARSMDCDVRVSWNGSKAHTYHAVQPGIWGENPISKILRSLGLFGHKAENKFIPHRYLVASEHDRYDLLAGLLDTDGHLNRGKNLDYITKSKRLAENIVFLARSLGYFVSWREKECYAQTGGGGIYYRLTISGHLDRIPFRRDRHNPPPRKMKKDVCRTGFTVEPTGVDDFYGFVLDGDHLYVDGNFMVHHNSGKSICIAQVAKDAATKWDGRVMILAHVKELVEQNAAKLRSICPELKVGVYSAGLGSRDTGEAVTVAGIQSVFNKAEVFGKQDLIIIDEVHTCPPDGEGRYRTFLKSMQQINPRVRLIGFTATPYRTQGGLICKPENLLNEICYEIGVKELINQGYLSKITARAGKCSANTDDLHVRMGEFVAEDVERVMGEERLVSSACREIAEYAKDRQACLIFCTSIAHCRKVAKLIAEYSGEECAVVTGDTPDEEREETIRRLRGETVKDGLFDEKPPLKFCCNVSVLTTGTDIPRLDTIALLRPTNSPGLLVQMVGRGFRLSPDTGKTECLVLDYGRNIERHGPIDMIKVKVPGSGEKKGPLAKECPQCRTLVNLPVMLCPECGYQWPRKEPERQPHEARAANTAILSGEVSIETFPVTHTSYQVWTKRGAPEDAPKTVRVTYDSDFIHSYSEWLCPEHTGYARRKFERWWREHANPECPMPAKAEDVCEFDFMGMIREVKAIKVKSVSGQKYPEIIGYELGDYPVIEQNGNEEDIEYDDIPF